MYVQFLESDFPLFRTKANVSICFNVFLANPIKHLPSYFSFSFLDPWDLLSLHYFRFFSYTLVFSYISPLKNFRTPIPIVLKAYTKAKLEYKFLIAFCVLNTVSFNVHTYIFLSPNFHTIARCQPILWL